MANIIDGKALSAAIKDQVREQVLSLKEKYGRVPCLCVIIVGENPASQVYVRNKVRAAEYVGIASMKIELPADTSEEALLARIGALNADPAVDGILVQLPLPKHIDEEKVIDAIARERTWTASIPAMWPDCGWGRTASSPAPRPASCA